MHFKKDVTTNDKTLKIIIALLCCALCVSLFFNFKSPYINENKVHHLGKLTYQLPVDNEFTEKSEWVYGDFACDTCDIEYPGKNGTSGVDGKDGRVLSKTYVDMSTLTEVEIEYNMLGKKANMDETRSWSGENGDKPKIIQRMAIESDEGPTDSNGWNAGSYWRAYLTIDDANYIVTVRSLHDSNLTTIGEGVISSMDINKELKDEYEN